MCLLKRAIYGTKQPSRARYDKIHNILNYMNFQLH